MTYLEIRVLTWQEVIVDLHDARVVPVFSLGGAGLKNSRTGQTRGVFLGTMGLRMEDKGVSHGGIAVSRGLTHSADGSRTLGDSRVEMTFGFDSEEEIVGLGGECVMSWLDDLDPAGQRDVFYRIAGELEAYVKPFEGFEVGAYYLGRRGLALADDAWDPWRGTTRSSHEVGGFVRASVRN